MNGALVILFILVIIILILAIVTSSSALVKWNQSNQIVNIPNANCEEPAFEGLIDLKKYECCVSAGNITAKRYIPDLDLIVSSVVTPYIDACKGFCGLNGIKDDQTQCVDSAGQEAYTACLQLTHLASCPTAAMPIAYNDTTYFYAYSATNAQCKTTQPCGNI